MLLCFTMQENDKNVTKLRQQYEREVKELQQKYEKKMKLLREDLELRRKVHSAAFSARLAKAACPCAHGALITRKYPRK